jgi:chemotaxis protein MotB
MIRKRTIDGGNIWPGFVDALATLLLVITFLLAVFILAYFFISQACRAALARATGQL